MNSEMIKTPTFNKLSNGKYVSKIEKCLKCLQRILENGKRNLLSCIRY